MTWRCKIKVGGMARNYGCGRSDLGVGLTQWAISMQIRRHEAAPGCGILDRGARRAWLNEYGLLAHTQYDGEIVLGVRYCIVLLATPPARQGVRGPLSAKEVAWIMAVGGGILRGRGVS